MDKIKSKFTEIRTFCEKNADPAIVKKYSRYFKEGFDAYGLPQGLFESQKKEWLKAWKDEMAINDYILLGDMLAVTGKYEEGSFGIAFIYANRKQLSREMFEKLGVWLDKGLANWAHVDYISTKVLAYFLNKNIVGIDALIPWTGAESIWKKRAVPVTLLEALKMDIPLNKILNIIDPIMPDEAKKVQQGLGWLLRESWKKYPDETEKFLMKWKNTCGRTIIQYATEKMDKEYRLRFRREKSVIN